jgi:hypothetical protein
VNGLWDNQGLIHDTGRNISFLQIVNMSSGAHPALYPMGNGGRGLFFSLVMCYEASCLLPSNVLGLKSVELYLHHLMHLRLILPN